MAPAFLLIENDFVVADDISEAIRYVVPGARIVSASRDTFLAGPLPLAEGLVLAVLSLNGSEEERGRAAELAAAGIRILVIADEADPASAAAGWDVCLRPFASDDLAPFIRAALAGGVR